MRWVNFNPDLEQANCCWDQSFINTLVESLPDNVIGTAARYQLDHVKELADLLRSEDRPVLLLTSDEESTFPWEELASDEGILDVNIWVQSPRATHHPTGVLKFIPVGYTMEGWDSVRALPPEHARDYDWTFAGQITHERRKEFWEVFQNPDLQSTGLGLATDSFISPDGWPLDEYRLRLALSKTAPAPSGPVSADTFRCWEALEAGAVPIVDTGPYLKPAYGDGFWELLLGEEPPFPIVPHWEFAPGHIQNIAARYPRINNTVFAWWQGYKRRLRTQLAEDAGVGPDPGAITVVIPTSPIPSHPSTEVIEAVYDSVRERLPGSEVLLLIDEPGPGAIGERLADYEEYKRRLLWLANHKWNNAVPILHKRHLHQAEMLRRAMPLIRTQSLLFVEHDTPLCGEIPFPQMTEAISSGSLNLIRLHHEASILEPHRHLMLGQGKSTIAKLPFVRTVQWSQRPHLASTDFYRWLLDTYFELSDRTFIEDRMHGIVQDAHARYGETGWRQFRMAIYAPEGDMKRSWHLDGRGEDPKAEIYKVGELEEQR